MALAGERTDPSGSVISQAVPSPVSVAGRCEQPWLAPPGEDPAGRLVPDAPTTVAVEAVDLDDAHVELVALERLHRMAPERSQPHGADRGGAVHAAQSSRCRRMGPVARPRRPESVGGSPLRFRKPEPERTAFPRKRSAGSGDGDKSGGVRARQSTAREGSGPGVRHARYLAEHLPQARLVTPGGTDSLWFTDSPEVLDEAIAFLRTGPGSR